MSNRIDVPRAGCLTLKIRLMLTLQSPVTGKSHRKEQFSDQHALRQRDRRKQPRKYQDSFIHAF